MKDLLVSYRHTFGLCWKIAPAVTVVNLLLIALTSGAVTLTALAQRFLIDAAGIGTTAAVVTAAGLGVLAHAGNFLLWRVQGEVNQDLTVRVARELDLEVLSLSAAIPTLEHLERPEFLDRVTNLRRGTASLARALWWGASLVGTLLSVGASIWLLAAVHPALPLLAGCVVPLLLLTHRGDRHRRLVRDRTAESERHERALHELCLRPEPAKELRIAGTGPELSDRAGRLWDETTRQLARARLRTAGYEAVGWLILTAALGAALLLMVDLHGSGQAGIGDVVLVITLATALSGQIDRVLNSFTMVSDGGHVTGHYLWLKEYARARPAGELPAPAELSGGISLRRVSFSYPGTTSQVLRNMDLELRAGSIVAIVGLNGTGKTTLIKLLTGLYRPGSGTIAADGIPLADMAPGQWANRCAGVFQDFAKLQLLARENVGVGDLPRLDDPDAIADAVTRAAADSVVAGLPDRLDTQLGTLFQGVDLSHGQWQRLALARGIMRARPLLLILDEPTAALDPQVEHELFEQFAAEAREAAAAHGTISVLVSHRFSTVHMADHIVVLDDGRVSEQGSHTDLLAAGGRYAHLFTAQATAYAREP
ncbi:ABC transporter ATP-binding protein [Nonomuraea sp. NPDC004297]